jgi:hypothetical protein
MSSFGFGSPGALEQAGLSQYAAMGHAGYDVYKGSRSEHLQEIIST